MVAELPTGQITNHYEMSNWDLFQVPEAHHAAKWDGHSPEVAATRIREYLMENS